MPDPVFIKIKNVVAERSVVRDVVTDSVADRAADCMATDCEESDRQIVQLDSAGETISRFHENTAVVNTSEKNSPAISLDGAMATIETAADKIPPWQQPRSVVEANGQAFTGQVSSAEYPALKKRLVSIPTRSAQSRQSLYRDKYTGQFWLGLHACIGSLSQQIELLKPLGQEVAESLSASSRALSDRLVH